MQIYIYIHHVIAEMMGRPRSKTMQFGCTFDPFPEHYGYTQTDSHLLFSIIYDRSWNNLGQYLLREQLLLSL